MRKDFQRRHDAHLRCHCVCNEHSAFFDATPVGQATREALDAYVADVDRLLGLQERSVLELRAAKHHSRFLHQALHEAANLVINFARFVHLDEIVGPAVRRGLPRKAEQLLAFARRLLDLVSVHAEAFAAGRLLPGSVEHLATTIQRLEAAKEEQTAFRQRFAAAAKMIRARLTDADKALAVLESLALTAPAAVPELLAKLRSAKRVGHVRIVRKECDV